MKKISILFIILSVISLTILFSSCKNECAHEYDAAVPVADCEDVVIDARVCKKCGVKNNAVIQPKGHKFTENKVEVSCTSDGYTLYTCDCGFSYKSDIVSALGHDLRAIVNAPTCEKVGNTQYICRRCDFVYTSDVVKPLGHSFETAVTSPTCTEAGFTVFKCKNCSFEYFSDHMAPTGHSISENVIDPSCLEEGYTLYSCDNCDYEYISDMVPKKEHTYTSEVLREVNCTETGEIKYTCSCGDTYSVSVAPFGHDFIRSVTMPTLSDMGFTEFLCKNCEYGYVGEYRFYSSILKDAYAENDEPLALGIDVSCYNHSTTSGGEFLPIDWQAVSDGGVDYVILKAGSTLRENGTKGGIEVTFEEDYLGAHEAGLDVGVYFYTYAKNVAEIRIDAYLLLSILDGKQFEYPIYLDLEDDSLRGIDKATLNEMCVEFFTILQRAGYYTGLYVNNEWLYNVIDSDIALSKFEIWYARYDGNDNIWNTEKYGLPLGMWQYTDCGALDAFGEIEVDMNIAYKDYPSLIVNGGYNGYDGDVNFADDLLEFVWIAANSLTVRSDPTFDGSDNIVGYATFGERFVVLEKSDAYTKILFNGVEAYISSNTAYISFSPVW